jgi:predicted site-specific integrase-resolvase
MIVAKRAERLKDVAVSLGCSYDLLFRASRDGRMKVIRLGNRLFVPANEIERIAREGLPRHAPPRAR